MCLWRSNASVAILRSALFVSAKDSGKDTGRDIGKLLETWALWSIDALKHVFLGRC